MTTPVSPDRAVTDPIGLVVDLVSAVEDQLTPERIGTVATAVAGGRAKSRRLAAALLQRPGVAPPQCAVARPALGWSTCRTPQASAGSSVRPAPAATGSYASTSRSTGCGSAARASPTPASRSACATEPVANRSRATSEAGRCARTASSPTRRNLESCVHCGRRRRVDKRSGRPGGRTPTGVLIMNQEDPPCRDQRQPTRRPWSASGQPDPEWTLLTDSPPNSPRPSSFSDPSEALHPAEIRLKMHSIGRPSCRTIVQSRFIALSRRDSVDARHGSWDPRHATASRGHQSPTDSPICPVPDPSSQPGSLSWFSTGCSASSTGLRDNDDDSHGGSGMCYGAVDGGAYGRLHAGRPGAGNNQYVGRRPPATRRGGPGEDRQQTTGDMQPTGQPATARSSAGPR
jgi:hypothetical protein